VVRLRSALWGAKRWPAKGLPRIAQRHLPVQRLRQVTLQVEALARPMAELQMPRLKARAQSRHLAARLAEAVARML
jgi:hypothetical protein